MKFNPVKCYVIPLNLIIYFITIYYNQLDFYLSNLTGTILLITSSARSFPYSQVLSNLFVTILNQIDYSHFSTSNKSSVFLINNCFKTRTYFVGILMTWFSMFIPSVVYLDFCHLTWFDLIIYFITIYYNQLDFYLSNLTGTILLIKVRYSLQQSHLKKKTYFQKKIFMK
jgi:hypothetical protein